MPTIPLENFQKQSKISVWWQKKKSQLTKTYSFPKESTNTSPFIIKSKKNKISWNKSNQGNKKTYLMKTSDMKKKVKKDTIKWEGILCSWVGKINIVKMTTSSKANYKSM